MLRFPAAMLLCTVVAACNQGGAPQTGGSGPRQTPYERIPVAGPQATAEETVACEAVGGSIEPGGLLGYDICVQAYPDAGLSCSDSSECVGRCLLDVVDADDPGPITGQCERDDNPFGCVQEVADGQLGPAFCVD